MTEVGWKFVVWSRSRIVPCNVGACSKPIQSGYVRVDNQDCREPGFIAICADCYFKIQLGIDPDPGAFVPDWERERRGETD